MEKSKHGGARPGSGRKPSIKTPTVPLSVRISIEAGDIIDQLKASSGLTKNEIVNELILKHKEG